MNLMIAARSSTPPGCPIAAAVALPGGAVHVASGVKAAAILPASRLRKAPNAAITVSLGDLISWLLLWSGRRNGMGCGWLAVSGHHRRRRPLPRRAGGFNCLP